MVKGSWTLFNEDYYLEIFNYNVDIDINEINLEKTDTTENETNKKDSTTLIDNSENSVFFPQTNDPSILLGPIKCKLHKMICKKYCETCDLLLCTCCLFENDHRPHNMCDVKHLINKIADVIMDAHQLNNGHIQIHVKQNHMCIKSIPKIENTLMQRKSQYHIHISRIWSRDSLFIRSPPFGRENNHPIYGLEYPVKLTETAPTKPLLTFGSPGKGDGMLCRPWGIACNRLGHFIVADGGNHRIQVFDDTGNYLHQFGKMGTLIGEFKNPTGVAVNRSNFIIVADRNNHRIQVFNPDGEFSYMFGKFGNYSGEFNFPCDVACNKQSQILVSNLGNHSIQLFNSDGTFVAKYCFKHYMYSFVEIPRGVCFGPNNEILVSDFENQCLLVLNPELEFRKMVGMEGMENGNFLRPQGVVCDDEGRIAVVDSKNHRIQIFEHDGGFMWKVGRYGSGPTKMNLPSGIALTRNGKIAVVDQENNRVHVY